VPFGQYAGHNVGASGKSFASKSPRSRSASRWLSVPVSAPKRCALCHNGKPLAGVGGVSERRNVVAGHPSRLRANANTRTTLGNAVKRTRHFSAVFLRLVGVGDNHNALAGKLGSVILRATSSPAAVVVAVKPSPPACRNPVHLLQSRFRRQPHLGIGKVCGSRLQGYKSAALPSGPGCLNPFGSVRSTLVLQTRRFRRC